jgi:hypothetical protein
VDFPFPTIVVARKRKREADAVGVDFGRGRRQTSCWPLRQNLLLQVGLAASCMTRCPDPLDARSTQAPDGPSISLLAAPSIIALTLIGQLSRQVGQVPLQARMGTV